MIRAERILAAADALRDASEKRDERLREYKAGRADRVLLYAAHTTVLAAEDELRAAARSKGDDHG